MLNYDKYTYIYFFKSIFSDGAEDTQSFQEVLRFLNENGFTNIASIIWTISPGERATKTLQNQAAFIEQFKKGKIWDNVILVCKQPTIGWSLEKSCSGALQVLKKN